MRKFLLKLTVLMLLTPAVTHAYALSCGDFLPAPNADKEVYFELYTGRPGDTQNVIVHVGKPHNWLTATLVVTQKKESTGMLSHKEIFQSGNRFLLQRSAGLMGGSDQYYITVNLPEIGYVMNNQPIGCIGYH